MPITVITETGDVIPVSPAMQDDKAALDAHVAAERAALGLPVTPLDEKGAKAFLAARAKLAVKKGKEFNE